MTDRPLVAVRVPEGPAWIAAVQSLWDDGAAVLPLPANAPDATIAATLEALRPSALLSADGAIVAVDGGVPVRDGTAVVIATSGSTGTPKGVELSHAALEWSARASLERLGASADDRWLCCLPLHHVAGLQVLTRSRLLGTAPILAPFSTHVFADHPQTTMVALVPTMLRRLLDAQADLGRVRCVLLGGAAAGETLLDEARANGLRVVTTYGMTETCGGCVYDGVPLDGVEVDVAAAGTIRLRGPMLFSGYRGDERQTAAAVQDGWFLTGDLGRWSDAGRLEVLGRADDVVVTGGENVAAGWVAELLEAHPAVAEAAVVGAPDAEWGQRVVAFVVPAGDVEPTLDQLRGFLADRAPRHAAPRQLVVVRELPRLATGKIDRLALQRLVTPVPPS